MHPSVNATLEQNAAAQQVRIARAMRRVRSTSHPCPGCGQYVSGKRPACLKCTVSAFVEAQEKEHPEVPVDRASIAAFLLDHPEVNTL